VAAAVAAVVAVVVAVVAGANNITIIILSLPSLTIR